jgi:hypothetical protein
VNNALVRFGIQLWRLAHEDLMMFVCEEGRVGLWRLEGGHTAMLIWSQMQVTSPGTVQEKGTEDFEMGKVRKRCESV